MQKLSSRGWIFAYSSLGIGLLVFCALFFSLIPLAWKKPCCNELYSSAQYSNPNVSTPSGGSSFWSQDEKFWAALQFGISYLQTDASFGPVAYERNGPGTTTPMTSNGITPTLKWGFGFDVSASSVFFHSDWDLSLDYGYYSVSNYQAHNSSGNNVLIANQGNTLNGQTITSANTDVSYLRNRILLTSMKQFHFPENILVQTGLGVKGNWSTLREDIYYSGGSLLGNGQLKISDKQKVWALGPRVGAKTKWLFVNTFYLKGGVFSALQYSQYRLKYNEISNVSSNHTLQYRENLSRVLPSIDLGIGLGASEYLLEGTIFSSLSINYTFEYTWNENELIQVQPFVPPRYSQRESDISRQGVTVQLRLNW